MIIVSCIMLNHSTCLRALLHRRCRVRRPKASAAIAAAACLALLLLAAAPGAAAQATSPEAPSGSPASVSDTTSSSSNAANTSSSDDDQLSTGAWLLQRLQRAMQPPRPNQGADDNSSDGTTADDDMSDFASTANALTQQAVREGNVRAAALAQRTAAEDEPQNSDTSDGSSSSSDGTSGTTGNVAMLQLLELQQQTANSTVYDADSTDGSDEGLQQLLQTIRQQWNTARNRQRQQQQPASQPPANAGEQWVSGLKAMADKYPSLKGFARLASNNSALVVSDLVALFWNTSV